jgi:hypothetical protein
MIEIVNKRVHDFIVAKDEQVEIGRAISREIEGIEIKIKRLEEKEKKITAKVVPPKELTDRGDELVKQITALNTELTKIANQINDSKLAAVPEEMKNEHMQLLKDKQVKERERNKVALKVQKIKDKVVPIIQKEIKPLLKNEFDDIETAKTKDGKVIINTFNHLDDFKRTFRNRR